MNKKLSLEAHIRGSNMTEVVKRSLLQMLSDRSGMVKELIGLNALLRVLLSNGPIEISKDLYTASLQQEVVTKLGCMITVRGNSVKVERVDIDNGTTEQTGG